MLPSMSPRLTTSGRSDLLSASSYIEDERSGITNQFVRPSVFPPELSTARAVQRGQSPKRRRPLQEIRWNSNGDGPFDLGFPGAYYRDLETTQPHPDHAGV